MSLPTGWLATADGPQTLVIGPQGRGVMRFARSSLRSVPPLDQLKTQFSSALANVSVESLDAHEEEDLVLWRARLTPEKIGGRSWMVALGAKQVGGTVFLCSTEPGATDGEVKAAADSCLRLGQ